MFLALPTPELALARVAERVRAGGHDVPPDVVRRRFQAGLQNLLELYVGVVDSWEVYDNSQPSSFWTIASSLPGGRVEVRDPRIWRILRGWMK